MNKPQYISAITIMLALNIILIISSGYRKFEFGNISNSESGDTIRVKVSNIENTILILEDSVSERTLDYFHGGEFISVFRDKTTNRGIKYSYDSVGVLDRKWNIHWPDDPGLYDYFNEYYMGDIDFPGIIKLGYVFEDEFLMLKSDTVMVLNYKNGKIVK